MKDRRECIDLEEKVRDPENRVFGDGQTCTMNHSDMQGNICREWNEQSPVGGDCLVPQKRGFLKSHEVRVEDSTRCRHPLMGMAPCSELDSMDMRLKDGHNSVCRCPRTDPADSCSLDCFHEVLIGTVPVALGP
jgi:hypothetical protein